MAILRPKHYYFIGIGGISMSGIAALLAAHGYRVSGSDIIDSPIIQKLKRKGILVNIGHSAFNIGKDIDFVVYSAAIPYFNPELKQAKKQNISIIKRSELIGDLMRDKYGIAITGMHGKTTTACMLTLILEKAGRDPTALIGTELKELGGNYRVGEGDCFVAEACEYYDAFLDFKPKAGILTNIEAEHLDYFGNLSSIIKSFSQFVAGLPGNGLLVVCKDNKNNLKVIPKARCLVVTYGFDQTADVVAFNVNLKAGYTLFDVRYSNKILKGFELRVPGIHNVLNATACITFAINLGIKPAVIKEVLKSFCGAERRFEIIGRILGITLVSDYAHHPTEIQTTLEGASKFYPKSRILCIFQPHQYKRTKSLLKDFARSFNNVDLVLIPDIYLVRGRDTKKDIQAVSPEKLVAEIKKNKGKAKFVDGFEETVRYIIKVVKPGDILIIMGAGNIYKMNNIVVKKLKHKEKCDKFIKAFDLKIKKNIKLAPYTTFKIGGLTDLFFKTNKIEELKKIVVEARKFKLPIFILGGGSNILISDEGFRGLVIKNNCRKIKVKHNRIIAESGALLSDVVKKTIDFSLSGLEFAAGIPGTIGGAIVNNAGFPDKSIGNILTRALILDEKGKVQEVDNSYFKFKYRASRLKKTISKDIILKVELQLAWEQPEIIDKKMKEILKTRKEKQPTGQSSAGSIFKNPSAKQTAGFLLEKAGLKRKRVGKAYVSPKHANFIIANREASAQEVTALIKQLKDTVKEKYNIDLKEEIQYIGEWNDKSL
jgi:UDP-N-acetylmuramate--alanine ligase